MNHQIIDGHFYISQDYQRVIKAESHGKFENSENHWVEDTSGILLRAEDWVPFHG